MRPHELPGELPMVVRDVTAAYLSAADAAVPGFVQGLYLTGSVALADFHPAGSDLDFVAVSATPATTVQAAALERVHSHLAARWPRPFFDGPYLTWDELAADPEQAAPGPHAHQGRLRHHVTAERHPVTWHTLARHGITVRGPNAQDLRIDTDPERLAAWTRRNLDTYWRRWWRRSSRLTSPAGLACLGSWAPAWGVLGVSRLHYTLATGQITSKHGAGQYARTVFDLRWHHILDECLRIRRGQHHRSLYRNPFTRRSHALAFIDTAINDTNPTTDH